ncbi:hypothetical protein VCV18_012447 [Metarhizium anisopliae]
MLGNSLAEVRSSDVNLERSVFAPVKGLFPSSEITRNNQNETKANNECKGKSHAQKRWQGFKRRGRQPIYSPKGH